jgi:hypothetical protein
MARKRLTEEEAIAKWGSLRRYEGHLRAVKRYNAEHYEEQREYRRKNRAKLSQYTMEWRKTHHDQALASVKKRIKFKMETDPAFKQACRDRIRNRRTLIDLGILKKGWTLHYPDGQVSRTHWLYMDKEAHQALHSAFGKCNSDVPMERVLECPHLIKVMYEYDNGKLYKWRGSYNGRRFQPLCRSKEEWKKEIVK